MDLDLAYDVGQRTYEAAKATTIDQSATETAAYGIGLVGGVIGGFGGEITSEREAGDFGTEEAFSSFGKGVLYGLPFGVIAEELLEARDYIAEYGSEVAPNEAYAASLGAGTGTVVGATYAEMLRDWDSVMDATETFAETLRDRER